MSGRRRRVDEPRSSSVVGELELIAFKTLAELRAERQRTYLGFVWWFVEPLIYMSVFYFMVDVLEIRGRAGTLPFLIVGIVVWRWYQSSITNCMSSIMQAAPMLQSIRIRPYVFPMVALSTDALKFILVLLVMMIALFLYGIAPSRYMLLLPVVLAFQFLLIAGIGLLASSVVPFIPDIRFAINPILQVQFFVSGIFFDVKNAPESVARWLNLNPMIVYIEAVRDVLLENRSPPILEMVLWGGISISLFLLGLAIATRMGARYAKLPS